MISRTTLAETGIPASTWQEPLADGTIATIRIMRLADAALEHELLTRCSPQTRRLRFLGAISPTLELAQRLTRDAIEHGVGLIATIERNGVQRAVGEASFRVYAGGTAAECEVVVSDEQQGLGLGVALMRHLIEIARRQGVRKLVAIDAAQNGPMEELAEFLGFDRRISIEDSTLVIHSLALDPA